MNRSNGFNRRQACTAALSIASLALTIVAPAGCATDPDAPGAAQGELGATTGSGPGGPPVDPPPGGGGGPIGPPGGGGGPTDPGGEVHVPTAITGGSLTLAYWSPANYVLPRWSTLPEVRVVEQLMIVSYTQPDWNGPVTSQGAGIWLRIQGDPHVDVYQFSFAPGTPGDPFSFRDRNGNWFRRSGGVPSAAGPPFTGRPEIVMDQAISSNWTVLSSWAIPDFYVPNGWPAPGELSPNTRSGLISLNLTAGIVGGIYGLASLAAFGGGPLCAPATAACGGAIMRTSAAFVFAYNTMQAAISGQGALQAAAGGAVVALMATWRTQLVQGVLTAVTSAAGICAASSATCAAEAAHFCGLSQAVPGNVVICTQDTRLTAFNAAGIGYVVTIAIAGAIDVGITVFRNFGFAVGN